MKMLIFNLTPPSSLLNIKVKTNNRNEVYVSFVICMNRAMSKTYILDTEEAEILPVRKWNNIRGDRIKLKDVDFIKWVPMMIWL